ncbi:hypothetical protein CFO_g3551 [Ceratocystis platani]|uniref:Mso1 N-terminal domain-containing protein n=1 Tax=Ceratocystis fimbriata f. sp. platani TaxID=88771 RepID=A0A0F8BNJ6_CERFI|nr:hypothetical protein CFO_g3551 [Ceratocystis platani]
MSSWYNNLINKTSSGIRGFLQAEADGDTEDDTHVCRVLRSYYGEKGRALPSWLPPDPRAPPPPVIPVNTGPAIGARYGGLSNGQNAAGGGGFSSLWDTPSNGSQQQQPQSLRQGGGRPAFGAQQSTGARQSPFAPQQNAQQQDNRPGIQKGGGSYQNTYREASTPAPNGGGSAQDRLKQRLWGGARTISPQSASGGPFQPPPPQQQQQQQQQPPPPQQRQQYSNNGYSGYNPTGGGGGYQQQDNRRGGGLPSGPRMR